MVNYETWMLELVVDANATCLSTSVPLASLARKSSAPHNKAIKHLGHKHHIGIKCNNGWRRGAVSKNLMQQS